MTDKQALRAFLRPLQKINATLQATKAWPFFVCFAPEMKSAVKTPLSDASNGIFLRHPIIFFQMQDAENDSVVVERSTETFN